MRKQEGVFTDNSASVRVVLWQNDIDRIKSGCHYKISRAVVKEYEGNKYITLNRKSDIKESSVAVQQRFTAQTLFKNDKDEATSLLLFDDKLKQLVKIYEQQNNMQAIDLHALDTLDDDTWMEILLTVNAKVFFNQKRNVVSVTTKDA